MNSRDKLRLDQAYIQLNFLKVKDENLAIFNRNRQRYLDKRKALTQSEVKLYQSFFSFPKSKAKGVFIELIEWDTIEQAEQITEQLASLEEGINYFKTFDLQDSFRMRPEDGKTFDAKQLLHSQQAIEFAVRQIKPTKRKIYPKWRKIFLSNIITKKGYEFDREFVSIDEDLHILLFGWDSIESFERAGKEVRRSPIVMLKLLRYFSLIRNRAFQVGKLVVA